MGLMRRTEPWGVAIAAAAAAENDADVAAGGVVVIMGGISLAVGVAGASVTTTRSGPVCNGEAAQALFLRSGGKPRVGVDVSNTVDITHPCLDGVDSLLFWADDGRNTLGEADATGDLVGVRPCGVWRPPLGGGTAGWAASH